MAKRVLRDRRLDLGAFVHGRGSRHQVIGGDLFLGLLVLLEQVGDRGRRQIVVGPEIKRQAQVDQRRKLIALAAAGAAKSVKRFRHAFSRVVHDWFERLARGHVGQGRVDHGMVGSCFGEVLINRLRAVDIAVAGERARIGVDDPQGRLVALVRALKAALGFLGVAQHVGDQAGVKTLEDVEGWVLHAVERVERALLIVRAGERPGRKHGRRDVARLPAKTGVELGSGDAILPSFDGARGQRQTNKRVVWVTQYVFVRNRGGLIDLAGSQR